MQHSDSEIMDFDTCVKEEFKNSIEMDQNELSRQTESAVFIFSRKNSEIESQFKTCESPMKIEDFRLIKLIGKGTFGKVYLVQDQKTGKQYAMKSIRKDRIIKHNSIESIQAEKLILLQVKHPFIVSMDYVFTKQMRIYFIMTFVSGGDL